MRFHVPIRLRWNDLDAYNHVNNARLLSLLEEARVRAFWSNSDGESSPLAVIDGEHGGETQTLIARQEVEYLAPIPYQSRPIDIQMWIGRLGAASCDVQYEVWSPVTGDPDDAEGRLKYTVASTTIVFIDTASRRPRRLREHERDAWGAYVEAPIRFRGRRAP